MIRIIGRVVGLDDVLRTVNRAGVASSNGVAAGVSRGTQLGVSIVRGNASGRPGPRAVTGDFRRSITGDTEVAGNLVFAQIGSNAAQALRLEYGFFGTDRLGRRFNQPPYSWLQPSVPAVRDAYIGEITRAVKAALG